MAVSSYSPLYYDRSVIISILYFDDDCIMCNTFAKWIVKMDRREKIYFASIKELEDILPKNIDSAVYYSDDLYIRSDAVIEVLNDATNTRVFSVIKVMPEFFRNRLYDFIAGNRHRLNKGDSCEINPKVRKRIISS
ncbi:thiol-disulfide oxidoreductase DCC family protein [Salinicoccus sp. YB14-2]|uniref:thiol-disulfide oxidoreductase DCC family protein n=1 Tax=Salinicoccus sp. YB14-2 TaxID=1572701 RepID=UPI002101AA48|nr:DUF393 domain-containing protein [Salinicoccus sp. YB14-2]